ncbi:MAG: alpha/beta hydrolase, partial [Ruminococcus sp.]|nr:alpha/beta hydrolase [Ruminococcus sp.]
IDTDKIYLHGMSGGGETGSIIMGKHPELFTAYLETSSRWDGDLSVRADSHTPVYMAIAENDTYYGSGYLKDAYNELYELYKARGLSDKEIDKILVLDVKEDEYFTERGYRDWHAGGNAFSADE